MLKEESTINLLKLKNETGFDDNKFKYLVLQ